MAATFTIKSNSYDGRYLELVCTQERDIVNNKSIISWVLSSKGGNVNYYAVGATTVKINGEQVYYKARVDWSSGVFPAAKGSVSGQIEVSHNTYGDKTISVSLSTAIYYKSITTKADNWELDSIPMGAQITSATNFTDEEKPSFTYSNPRGADVDSIETYIAFDTEGANKLFEPLPLSPTGNNAKLTLSQSQIEALWNHGIVLGAAEFPIYYFVETVIDGETFTSIASKTCTIINSAPTAYIGIVDINETTKKLTGDMTKLIKGFSKLGYSVNAQAYKNATITSYSVVYDGITNNNNLGSFEVVRGKSIRYAVTDSRNISTQHEQTLDNFIDYFEPTCVVDSYKIVMDGELARANIVLSGTFFNESFGAAANALSIQIQHTGQSGWITLTDVLPPEITDNTYKFSFGVSNVDYTQPFTFKCRAYDLLGEAITSEYTLDLNPVFDWSKTDFNFNVPINMNNTTALRMNESGRLIVSGINGIYLRPNGTDNEDGQIVILPTGEISGGAAADYVIDTGTASMGSNGTWYWTKWQSGKAECYGIRNYGNMAITTAWGELFTSADFNQDLPSGLFAQAPDFINIMLQSGGYGAWVSKGYDDAPTASSTGTFCLVRAKSNTLSQAKLSFYVIGRWK